MLTFLPLVCNSNIRHQTTYLVPKSFLESLPKGQDRHRFLGSHLFAGLPNETVCSLLLVARLHRKGEKRRETVAWAFLEQPWPKIGDAVLTWNAMKDAQYYAALKAMHRLSSRLFQEPSRLKTHVLQQPSSLKAAPYIVLPLRFIFFEIEPSMDPLTALSVAGTIVQFADFGTKLLSEGCAMYKSSIGVLSTNQELDLVTSDLRAVIGKLEKLFQWQFVSISPTGEEQEDFNMVEKICDDATKLAEEIVVRVNELKVKGRKYRKWKSFRQAIKSAWTREEISSLVKRRGALKDALLTRVTYSIWYGFKVVLSVHC